MKISSINYVSFKMRPYFIEVETWEDEEGSTCTTPRVSRMQSWLDEWWVKLDLKGCQRHPSIMSHYPQLPLSIEGLGSSGCTHNTVEEGWYQAEIRYTKSHRLNTKRPKTTRQRTTPGRWGSPAKHEGDSVIGKILQLVPWVSKAAKKYSTWKR